MGRLSAWATKVANDQGDDQLHQKLGRAPRSRMSSRAPSRPITPAAARLSAVTTRPSDRVSPEARPASHRAAGRGRRRPIIARPPLVGGRPGVRAPTRGDCRPGPQTVISPSPGGGEHGRSRWLRSGRPMPGHRPGQTRLAQKRWMRWQASSSTAFEVGVGDAEEGRQAEGRAVHRVATPSASQQLDREVLVGLDHLAGRGLLADQPGAWTDRRRRRPRASGSSGPWPGSASRPPGRAALWNSGLVRLDEVLGAVQGLDRGVLRDRAGVRGGLGHHLAHGLDQRLGAGGSSRSASRSWRRPWRPRSWSGCGRTAPARPGRWWCIRSRRRSGARTCRRSAPTPAGGAAARRPGPASSARV